MKQLLVVLLVVAGLLVGVMSLYFASLSGVMGKMGLVGGDFRQEIDQNELARQLREPPGEQDCDLWIAVRLVPRYLLSKGEERVALAGELAGARIVCGVRQVQSGNVERGAYTIIKGLYYLKSHFVELRQLVEVDHNYCRLLGGRTSEIWVEGYLSSASGRSHDVVFEVYKQAEGARVRVDELCLD